MRRHSLKEMTGGWFVGAFEPNAVCTDAFEVGVKRYKAGTVDARHHHKIAWETTVIIEGHARMCDADLHPGDIITVDPGEEVQFHAVTDVTLVVVKAPSVADDKYLD